MAISSQTVIEGQLKEGAQVAVEGTIGNKEADGGLVASKIRIVAPVAPDPTPEPTEPTPELKLPVRTR